jgi:hypothetical protein
LLHRVIRSVVCATILVSTILVLGDSRGRTTLAEWYLCSAVDVGKVPVRIDFSPHGLSRAAFVQTAGEDTGGMTGFEIETCIRQCQELARFVPPCPRGGERRAECILGVGPDCQLSVGCDPVPPAPQCPPEAKECMI